MICPMWDPDLHAAEHALEVVEADIPEMGRYYHRHDLIVVRRGITYMSRRSALAHELGHHHSQERGPC
jgi:hypothetical protein